MAEFRIEIAGYTAAVTSLFDSTKDYCHNYLTDDAPSFSIRVTREDLAYEQAFLDAEAAEEGLRRRKFTEPFLERSAIQRAVAENLLSRDVLLIHGSTVAVDGQAFLFTAKCGTGKSTHTRFYREVFGERAAMVNDDKPFLRFSEEGILACGAPWSGKHGLDSNITVPLKGICVLTRGEENRIRRARAEEVLPLLRAQSNQPRREEDLPKWEKLLETLAQTVPLWQMACTKEPQAALVSQGAMGKNGK